MRLKLDLISYRPSATRCKFVVGTECRVVAISNREIASAKRGKRRKWKKRKAKARSGSSQQPSRVNEDAGGGGEGGRQGERG